MERHVRYRALPTNSALSIPEVLHGRFEKSSSMKWHVQLSRYAMVGLASNTMGYLLYLLLTYLGMGPKTAMTLLYLVGVMNSFYFNRSWSFQYEGRGPVAFVRYVAAYALGYVLNFAILWSGVERLGLPHQGVQFVAVVLVAGVLFFLHRHWVFAPLVARREMI